MIGLSRMIQLLIGLLKITCFDTVVDDWLIKNDTVVDWFIENNMF